MSWAKSFSAGALSVSVHMEQNWSYNPRYSTTIQ